MDNQQQDSNQSEVITPQPKPNYLKIIIVSVLIIITLSLIIYLFFQNQKLQKQVLNPSVSPTIQVPSPAIPPDETAGWKSFTSNNLGISFKYPPEYKNPEENINYISLISPLNPEPKKGYELQNGELKLEVYVSKAEPNETLDELINKKKEQSNSLGVDTEIINEEEILIGGIRAVKQAWKGNGAGQTILLINNNKEFGIIKYPAVTTRDGEFDQILSTFKFVDNNKETKLPTGWKYYRDLACNISIPIPPEKLDVDNRSWKTETQSNYDFLGFFKGNEISVIHRNPGEASGFISGMVTVACDQTNDSLVKLNSDFHSHLTIQASQNTIPQALIELSSNNDVNMWGFPTKEMTFIGGMFDPKQKYYLIVNLGKWYLITKKSDSVNSEINQQTNQIFDAIKFN